MKNIKFMIIFISLSLVGCSNTITPSAKKFTINTEHEGVKITNINYNKDTGDSYITSKVIRVYLDTKVASKLNKKDKDIIYSNLLKKLKKTSLITTALYHLDKNIIYLILSENHKKPTIGIKMIITDINNKNLRTVMIIKFLELLKTYENEMK